jgi:hypothetical protein
MVQDAVVAHGYRRLDAQAVDDGGDTFSCSQSLEHEPLNGDIVDFRLNGGRTIEIDLERYGFEARADAGLASDRGEGLFAQFQGYRVL